ncbi:MAG: L,D-transpeptidase [Byssovorax sp.]
MRAPSPAQIAWIAGILALPGACAPPPPTAPAAMVHPPPAALAPTSAPLAAPLPTAAEPPATLPDPPPPPPAPRLTSRAEKVWIYRRPRADPAYYMGTLRHGSSAALHGESLVSGPGCPGGFYTIEPRGFVCNDETVTLHPSTHLLATAAATRATTGPYPYHYALSAGAPMYNRIPTAEEQRRTEAPFGPPGQWTPLNKASRAHEDLATPSLIDPSTPLPSFLDQGGFAAEGRTDLVRQPLPRGSMVSFSSAFSAEGRTFLLSADQTLVPADRVRPFRPSAFHGVRLDGDIHLPIAFIRSHDRPRYLRTEAGKIEPAEGAFAKQSLVRLGSSSFDDHGIRYLETLERDASGKPLYLAERDATVIEALTKLPSGVAPGQKMIVVRITQGTLVAYEGLRPVYATLMSPGAGGVPSKGQDPVKASTTPLGVYPVTFKARTATMSPEKGDNRSFFIADVPHVQYFNPPFALHAAYWHERFGEPTSAGCINVSPIDAELLFQWSDPQVPEGWEGATGAGAPENGPTTAVVVRR